MGDGLSQSDHEQADQPSGPAAALVDVFRELRTTRPLTVSQLAVRTGLSNSHVSEVLRGRKAPSVTAADKLVVALGGDERMRVRVRVLAAALADLNRKNRATPPVAQAERQAIRSAVCDATELFMYRLAGQGELPCLAIVTGDIRRVTTADVWVNPENTQMRMSRFEDHSVSAVIRFEGARCDEFGAVMDDRIADELSAKVAGRTPVAPATTVCTGAGELRRKNGVRYVVHVAAVHGEPGAGYRQVREVARCVTQVLRAVEALAANEARMSTVLLPLLGAGTGGAELEPTVRAMLGAAVDHFVAASKSQIEQVMFSAYTELERSVCLAVFDGNPHLSMADGH